MARGQGATAIAVRAQGDAICLQGPGTMACSRVATAADGVHPLLTYSATHVTGLVPDGVTHVVVHPAEGDAFPVVVTNNVFAADFPAGRATVTWTAPDGGEHQQQLTDAAR